MQHSFLVQLELSGPCFRSKRVSSVRPKMLGLRLKTSSSLSLMKRLLEQRCYLKLTLWPSWADAISWKNANFKLQRCCCTPTRIKFQSRRPSRKWGHWSRACVGTRQLRKSRSANLEKKARLLQNIQTMHFAQIAAIVGAGSFPIF